MHEAGAVVTAAARTAATIPAILGERHCDWGI